MERNQILSFMGDMDLHGQDMGKAAVALLGCPADEMSLWFYTSPESKGTAPKSPALFPSSAATIRTFPHGVQAWSCTNF